MSKVTERKLERLPVVGLVVKSLKKIPINKERFSVYDLLKVYITGLIEGGIAYRASAITYSFFLAIFPFLLVVLNLIPYVPMENFQLDFWFFIDDLLPPGTHDFFKGIFFDIAGKKRAGLLSSGFFVAIFLTTNGVNALFGGFQHSYHTRRARSVFRSYLYSMMAAVLIIFILLSSIVLLLWFEVYMTEQLQEMGITQENNKLIHLGKMLYFVLIALICISIILTFGTDEREKSFFSAGSFFTIVLIGVTTYFFGIYVENFATYNQLYGSIGALLIFLFYIWINFIIILLGFELNAAIFSLKNDK